MADRTEIKGRVLSVSPTRDGLYSVVLGPPPMMYSFTARTAPKLGVELLVDGTLGESKALALGSQHATLTNVEDAKVMRTTTIGHGRVIPPEWEARVKAVMERPLYDYQVLGAGWMAMELMAGRGALLGDVPGLGKTGQSVAAVLALNLLPCLVVCPTTLKINWSREFAWAKRPPYITIIQGRTGDIPPAEVVIVNYDLLKAREGQLGKYGFKSVIFDEAHVLKEAKVEPGHRAAVATRLAHWIGHPILLTGTPLQNRPQEFWRLLHIIAPREWSDYEAYHARYCKAISVEKPIVFKPSRVVSSLDGRAERIEELQSRVAPHMLRRLKTDVLTDLPPKTRKSLLVELPEEAMQHYKQAEQHFIDWVTGDGRAHPKRPAHALVRMTYLRRMAARAKLVFCLEEYLRAWFDRDKVEPLVLFAYHREILDGDPKVPGGIMRIGAIGLAKALGIRVAALRGNDTPQHRQAAIDDFNEGRADLFCASVLAGGVGINLHKRCSEVLFLERTWVPSQLVQAEDRCHRLGITAPVSCTYMDAAGTIDEHVARVLEGKFRLVNQIVDGATDAADTFAMVAEVLKTYDSVGLIAPETAAAPALAADDAPATPGPGE